MHVNVSKSVGTDPGLSMALSRDTSKHSSEKWSEHNRVYNFGIKSLWGMFFNHRDKISGFFGNLSITKDYTKLIKINFKTSKYEQMYIFDNII